jgi:hypothetical protein
MENTVESTVELFADQNHQLLVFSLSVFLKLTCL